MSVLYQNANIYSTTARAYRNGSLLVSGDRIAAVFYADNNTAPAIPSDIYSVNLGGDVMLPGLVDVHTHGRDGFDFTGADEMQMRRILASYASAGTTSLFPTLASAPFSKLTDSAALIRDFKDKASTDGGAKVLGVHLEGRYLNPLKRGAHNPEYLVSPDACELNSFINVSGTPLHISAALELDGDGAFARAAKERGATLGLAHTCANYAEALKAYRMWNVSFTHLYNAMPSLHHRDGGPVLVALTCGGYVELICDGYHIDPAVVAFTMKNVGLSRFVLVTDSMAAAGAPDGEYDIAGTHATVREGIARTPDGNLAGSTLSMAAAVENLSRFCDIPLTDAILCATHNPAGEVGLTGLVGELTVGARADFLICMPDEAEHALNIKRVAVGGEFIT